MTDDELVQQVAARMRDAGWRGNDEDRLIRTARRRVATAAYHDDLADHYAFTGASLRRPQRLGEANDPHSLVAARVANRHLDLVLAHRIRSASCLLLISRAERDAALRLAPTWTRNLDDLLAAARAVLR